MPEQTRKAESHMLPMQRRAAPVQPATADAEARSVEVVWSTGARVRRFDWWTGRHYDEELSLEPGHVDLTRLENGAPLLNTHGAYDLAGVIGVVERAWLAKGPEGLQEGRAVVRFSDRQEVAPIWRDVLAGIIRNVSVGYAVRKYEITKEEGKPDLYRAVDWQPLEISLVPVGADAEAGTRNHPSADTFPCAFVINRAEPAHNQEIVMPKKTDDPAGQPAADENAQNRTVPAAAPPAGAASPQLSAAAAAPSAVRAETPGLAAPAGDAEAIRREAVAAERARAAAIRQRVASVGLPGEVADDLINRGVDLAHVGDALVDELARRGGPGPRGPVAQVTRDETETLHRLAENAILHRINPATFKLEDGAREFRGLSLLELARDLLQRRGISSRGLSKMELAGLALGLPVQGRGVVSGPMGTSDLANILGNTMNRTLRQAYDSAPRTFAGWARATTNPDFKTISRLVLSGAPALLKVNESGEYKRGSVSDGKETYSLATYGRTVAFTRQALINDDLDALSRLPMLFGRAAADLESDTVYGVITANGNMADGVALFHATHGNLAGSGGAIAVATLDAGRSAMRQQTGLEGRLINLAPRFLLVPSAKEQTAYQYTSSQFVPAKPADINEFRAGGRTALEPIVEPRLDANSATAWYLIADPAQIDTVEYCYLEGNEGVYTETRVGFEVDGVELKVRHDFAAKAIDHRGVYKNAGA